MLIAAVFCGIQNSSFCIEGCDQDMDDVLLEMLETKSIGIDNEFGVIFSVY